MPCKDKCKDNSRYPPSSFIGKRNQSVEAGNKEKESSDCFVTNFRTSRAASLYHSYHAPKECQDVRSAPVVSNTNRNT